MNWRRCGVVDELPVSFRGELKARREGASSPTLRRSPMARARHEPVVVVDYDPTWPAGRQSMADISVAVSNVENEDGYLTAIESVVSAAPGVWRV